MLFAIPAAYALARFRFRGANGFSLAVTVTQIVPGMLFFLPLYMLYICTVLPCRTSRTWSTSARMRAGRRSSWR